LVALWHPEAHASSPRTASVVRSERGCRALAGAGVCASGHRRNSNPVSIRAPLAHTGRASGKRPWKWTRLPTR